jgi:ppGpp synthetase/RelA/SpoT-type nucleotidyltranferase
MKKDIPKEFLDDYEARRNEFQDILEQITSLLRLRLGQLGARTGIRGRLTESRVKRPAKIWENVTKAKLSAAEAFTRVEDLLGVMRKKGSGLDLSVKTCCWKIDD